MTANHSVQMGNVARHCLCAIIQPASASLDIFPSPAAEYTPVTVRIQIVDVTVDSIYILPAVTWNSRELTEVRRHCAEVVFFLFSEASLLITKLGGILVFILEVRKY